jgi:hypothetical protein
VAETDPIAIANEVPKVLQEEIDWTLPVNDRRSADRSERSLRGTVSLFGSQIGRFLFHGVFHGHIRRR